MIKSLFFVVTLKEKKIMSSLCEILTGIYREDTHTHTHTHTHIYIYTHTHTHIHISIHIYI